MHIQVHTYPLRAHETGNGTGETLYVHLYSGNVIEVTPATAVRVTDREVIVLNGEETVATFAREDVFFASGEDMEPPSFE